MKNCAIEAREPGWIPHGGGDFGGDDFATGGGVFSLGALRTPGGLPPNFGTSMPAGHDGYFVFETTDFHVKFRSVTNTGSAAAGPFVVTVTLIGTFTFSGLAPGQSAARTWSACRVGTLLAVADRGRTVAESNEENNTRSLVSDC